MTKKMDAADGTPLSNAVFGIYSDRNCNNLIARLTSDRDGYTGTYRMEFDGDVNSTTVYCREIEAPEGYQRNDTIYHLTLTKANDDGQTRTFGENGINGLGVYFLVESKIYPAGALYSLQYNVYESTSPSIC